MKGLILFGILIMKSKNFDSFFEKIHVLQKINKIKEKFSFREK
jgi:hypothetical protein